MSAVTQPGTWVEIELTPGESVPALIVASRAPGLLLAVYPPTVPCTPEVVALDPEDAITYVHTTDTDLEAGLWPIIATDASFDVTRWPVAVFEDEGPGRNGPVLRITSIIDDAMAPGPERAVALEDKGRWPPTMMLSANAVPLYVRGLLNRPGRHVLASDPPWQMVRSKAAPAPRTVSFELVIPVRVAPERLHAIEDLLEAALSAVPEASVDGSAAAEDHSIIFVYGPEGGTLADKLGAVVASGAFPPGTEVRPL